MNNTNEPVITIAVNDALEQFNREEEVHIEKVIPITQKKMESSFEGLINYSYKVNYKIRGKAKSVYFGSEVPFTQKILQTVGMKFIRNRIGVKEGTNIPTLYNDLHFFSVFFDWDIAIA